MNPNIDLLNRNIFEATGFSGAKFFHKKFSNVGGDDYLFGVINSSLQAIPVNGKWHTSNLNTDIVIDKNAITNHPSFPEQPKLNYIANNKIKFTHSGIDSVGTISPDGKTIHWVSYDDGPDKPSSEYAYWNRISDVIPPVVTSPSPDNQGSTPPPKAGTSDANILLFQRWANTTYSAGLTEDGLAGPATNAAMTKYKKQFTSYLANRNSNNKIAGMEPTIAYIVFGVAGLGVLIGGFFVVRHFSKKPGATFTPRSVGKLKTAIAS